MPMRSITEELTALADRGLARRARPVDGAQGAVITVDGRAAINFSSNNYLGLADHPDLIEVAARAMHTQGFGAGASRLIVGNLSAHRQLEARIARWKRTEAALLFNSGYQANVGAVSALAGPEDAIYSDALNHASLIDGARLSRATVHVYPHVDLEALAARLAEGASFRRRLIITDSVFSMDGDAAPLVELVRLARRYSALLFVDEAHATGVLGPQGAGLALDLGVDLQMGTLGKALGGFGAFIAASRPLVDYLTQRARSFVYSTALPVPVAAFAHAAIELAASSEGDRRRDQLNHLGRQLHQGFRLLGVRTASRPAHVLPLVIGDPTHTMTLSEALLDRGVFAQGIRPPTVPEGSSRLRFALQATHTDSHVAAALSALGDLLPPAAL